MRPPDDFNPDPGRAEEIEPGVRRILAPNPSPMTYRGTNTYLIGTQSVAVVDPGPADSAHMQAILAATGAGRHISHIIVTHAHLDHSPLAAELSRVTGAPVLGFGAAHAGRSDIMSRLAQSGLQGGGEGIDAGFSPDHCVADGEIISGQGWTLRVIHTPGHLGNHICLALDDICLTADHVMGWATSMVSPPDGDLTDFMDSCERLRAGSWRMFLPGHGAPVLRPQERLAWLIGHRKGRETSILEALSAGPADAASLAKQIYTDTPVALLPAASRNVLAHLIDLYGKSQVEISGSLTGQSRFQLR